MSQTVTNIDALLKDVYEGPVADELNSETRLLDLFTKKKVQPWEGRQVVRPLRTARNEGVSATSEDNFLPNAGRQGSQKFLIPMRYLHGRISITAQAIKQSKSNRGSFVRALEFELDNLVTDLADDRNRILPYFGTGILALSNSSGAVTTLNVNTPGGLTTGQTTTNGARYLQPGMEISFWPSGGGSPRVEAAVTTIASIVSHSQVTLNIASPAGLLVGDEISRGTFNAAGQAGANRIEPDGILAGADDGTLVATYHNLSRNSNPILKSAVFPNVGAFSTDVLYKALHQADQQGSAKTTVMVTGSDSLLEYVKLTEADRRYIPSDSQPTSPDAGIKAAGIDWNKAVTFAGIPVRYDKDFPFQTIVGLDERYWERYVLVEGEWVDDDGAVLFRDANKDNFEARYRVWENFHCQKPVAQFRLDGITTTVQTFHVF